MVPPFHARRPGGGRKHPAGAAHGGNPLNLFTIPAGVPFLDTLATEWLERSGSDPLAVSRGLILLPTRRARTRRGIPAGVGRSAAAAAENHGAGGAGRGAADTCWRTRAAAGGGTG